MKRAIDVINRALEEIGVSEYPPNSNNVKYNTAYYGHPVSGSDYPWCAVFIWWILTSCEINTIKTASCMALADWFKSESRWHTTPQIGDVVFFKFNTNSRWTNHVGLVVDVKGDEITTIEGNTSINSDDNGGCVQKRKRSKNIVGYGRPYYADDSQNKIPVTDSNEKPVLKRGSKGKYVKAWQEYLLTCGIDVGRYGADGDYGAFTERAVKLYQRVMGLPVTGVIDADDWNSVGKYKL